ncbi:hypothetical protein ASG25_01920 [Rhizobium sp. Leaf384]|uniref:hypothetical protein n=1 Tax=Rhizobium sp. Leaf384 TaxID=1736358 RepID=UPI000713A0A8|nr:hypothetical protein [Rhizobium sp. Leaf384]KQS80391.1 hypothetical protein ASG25_01920 [Rhizobium sp. Leaf384]
MAYRSGNSSAARVARMHSTASYIGKGSIPGQGGAGRYSPIGARLAMGNNSYMDTYVNGASITGRGGTVRQINRTGAPLKKLRVGLSGVKISGAANSAKDIRVTNAGSGYTTATVTASGGGSSYDFRPVIVGGQIVAILNYSSGSFPAGPVPTLTITGDGVGATAVIDRFDGIGEASYNYDQSVSVDIEYPLNTYQNIVPTKTILRGTRLDVTDGELAVEVPVGAEYGIRTTATLGTAPTFNVVRTGSAITSIDITEAGSGLWAPWYDLTFTGGTGSGATARVYTYQGKAYRVDVTAAGNYTATPSVVLQFIIERPIVLMPLLGDKRQGGNPLTSGHPSAVPAFLASAVDGRSGVVRGDSIANGAAGGGDISGDAWGNFGWPARVLGRAGIGVLKHTLPGDYVSGYNANHAAQSVMIQALSGIDFALCQMGINDVTRGDSLAAVQASMIAEWQSYRGVLPAVYQSTITPYTTSTDGWVTLANQTAFSAAYASGGVRLLLNAWLRDGAPMSGRLPAATGSSAVGTVRVGQTGHPLSLICDIAAQVESKSDPTKHAPMAWGSSYVRLGAVADGIHLTDVYHAKVRGTVSALAVVGGSGWTVAPQVVFSGHGVPVATPTFTGGVLTGITPVSDGGIDYDYPPIITILPLNNAGTGATATAILTNKRITGYSVTAGGAGYTTGAVISHAGAVPPQATARIVGGQVVLAEADWWGGSDVSSVPTVTLVGGDGTGASVVASISKGIEPALLAA